VVGGGLSAGFHLLVLFLLAVAPRPTTLGDSGPSTVTVELEATTLEPPPPPIPAPSVAPSQGRAHQGLRAASRRLPRIPVTVVAREAEVITPEAPDAEEPHDGGEEQDDAAMSAPPPPPAPIVQATPVAPPPTKAPVIAPETARALRVYDTYPMLLAQASLSRAEVVVEVCVSDHGQVSDAVIAESSTRGIDNTLRTAIRSWRYRPLVVNGAPTPFCHFMRIKYALN
jgi:TonB family protein